MPTKYTPGGSSQIIVKSISIQVFYYKKSVLKQLTVCVNEYNKHSNAALKFNNITVSIGKSLGHKC